MCYTCSAKYSSCYNLLANLMDTIAFVFWVEAYPGSLFKCKLHLSLFLIFLHSPLQRPRSFWSTPRSATSGNLWEVPTSEVREFPVILRMLKVKNTRRSLFASSENWTFPESQIFVPTKRSVTSGTRMK